MRNWCWQLACVFCVFHYKKINRIQVSDIWFWLLTPIDVNSRFWFLNGVLLERSRVWVFNGLMSYSCLSRLTFVELMRSWHVCQWLNVDLSSWELHLLFIGYRSLGVGTEIGPDFGPFSGIIAKKWQSFGKLTCLWVVNAPPLVDGLTLLLRFNLLEHSCA